MRFSFETQYNQKSLAVMAKAIRRTVRQKRNRRSHIIGIMVIVIAFLLTLPVIKGEVGISSNTIITWLAALIIAVVFLFEDRINGYVARKRMLSGMQNSTSVFEDDKYTIITGFGKTEFYYSNINEIVETEDYYVFVFDMSHAQIYDKNNMTGGSNKDFRKFITDKAGKGIKDIK